MDGTDREEDDSIATASIHREVADAVHMIWWLPTAAVAGGWGERDVRIIEKTAAKKIMISAKHGVGGGRSF